MRKSFFDVNGEHDIKYIIEDILEYESNDYFFTGSNFFGLNDKKSDIDIVLKYKFWLKLKSKNRDLNNIYFDGGTHNKYFKDLMCVDDNTKYFQSFHVQYNQKIYNFIIVTENEFLVWRFATNIFRKLLDNGGKKLKVIMKDKQNRVDFFELLKNQYRVFLKNKEIEKSEKGELGF